MCVLCLQCFDAVGWAAGRASSLSKTEWWGAGVVLCLERCVDLHIAQLMPLLLTVSCSNKIQIGFTFLVPADLGSSGQRAVKRVCVCVFMCVLCALWCLFHGGAIDVMLNQLTHVVPEKGPLNGCVCVAIYGSLVSSLLTVLWSHEMKIYFMAF